jgi:hypothetical protein
MNKDSIERFVIIVSCHLAFMMLSVLASIYDAPYVGIMVFVLGIASLAWNVLPLGQTEQSSCQHKCGEIREVRVHEPARTVVEAVEHSVEGMGGQIVRVRALRRWQ